MTLDQCRADVLGAAGHPLVATPTLDALCAEGVRFASHYSQAAPCSPGRAALYTGHVPDEQPRRRERDAAGRPLRQPRARAAARGLRPDALRLHRHRHRPARRRRPGGSAARQLRRRAARLRVGFLLPEDQSPWLEWLDLARLRRARPLGRRAARRARPPRRALALGLPHGPLPRVARPPAGGLVRAPLLPAAALALRRGGGLRLALRPRRRRAADRAGRGRPPAARRHALAPGRRRPDRRGGAARAARAVLRHGHRGRRPARPGPRGHPVTRGVGRHGRGRASRTTASSWATTGSSRSSATSRRATTRPASSATRARAAAHGRVVGAFTENVDVLPTICELVGAPDPRPGRRPAAHLVPRGHDAAVVARRGALGVGLALRLHRPRRRGLAARPPPRAPEPRGRPHRVARLRPVRRRLVALLRPGHGPDVAHRVRRTPPSCSRSPRRSPGGARSTSTGPTPRCCSRPSGSAGGPRSSPRPWRRARGAAGRAARRSPRRR